MKTNIIITLQVEGIHCWPECPIEEVSFLRYPHRHIFHITCKKEVKHDDREIEIIQLKRKVLKCLDSLYPKGDFGRASCEEIAKTLFYRFDLQYCKVLEDNENGAEVTI